MTLSKAQKDARRVGKFKDDPVKQVTGVPNKKPISSPSERFRNASTFRKPDYTSGEEYNKEEENDMDTDSMAAGCVYDVEDE